MWLHNHGMARHRHLRSCLFIHTEGRIEWETMLGSGMLRACAVTTTGNRKPRRASLAIQQMAKPLCHQVLYINETCEKVPLSANQILIPHCAWQKCGDHAVPCWIVWLICYRKAAIARRPVNQTDKENECAARGECPCGHVRF